MKIVYYKNLLIPFISLFPLHIYASNIHTLDDLRKKEQHNLCSSFYASRDQKKENYHKHLLQEYNCKQKRSELAKLEQEIARENRLENLNEETKKPREEFNKLVQKYKNKQIVLNKIYEEIDQKVESEYPSSGLKGYFEDKEKKLEKLETESEKIYQKHMMESKERMQEEEKNHQIWMQNEIKKEKEKEKKKNEKRLAAYDKIKANDIKHRNQNEKNEKKCIGENSSSNLTTYFFASPIVLLALFNAIAYFRSSKVKK